MHDDDEQRELIMAEIVQAKTNSFMDLIRIIQEQTQSGKLKKSDSSMENLLLK